MRSGRGAKMDWSMIEKKLTKKTNEVKTGEYITPYTSFLFPRFLIKDHSLHMVFIVTVRPFLMAVV